MIDNKIDNHDASTQIYSKERIIPKSSRITKEQISRLREETKEIISKILNCNDYEIIGTWIDQIKNSIYDEDDRNGENEFEMVQNFIKLSEIVKNFEVKLNEDMTKVIFTEVIDAMIRFERSEFAFDEI